jgi:YegS/Rv2252/BmrU family lipid kinase
MKVVAIINPKAGKGAAVQLPVDTEILQTRAPGHAIELTRDALKRGVRTIFAVGGDGTVNEVVNGLFENEEPLAADAELVVIPRGTGSDFSRVLNRAVPRGEKRMIDVMKVRYTATDGTTRIRYSINVTSFGMGGEIAARVDQSSKPLGGRLAYLAATIQTAWSFPGKRVTLQLDSSKIIEANVTNVVVGNGQYHGAGMWVCPGAIIDDGLLDLTVIRYLRLPELVKSVPTLYGGGIYSHPKVESHRVKHLRAESREAVLIEIDGEGVGRLPIEISMVPKAVRVSMP